MDRQGWRDGGWRSWDESPDYNMIISGNLLDNIDWPAPVSPQLLHLSVPVQCMRGHCSLPHIVPPLLGVFFSLTLGKRGSDYKRGKKPQPVATAVFLRSSSCSPWLRLSLYRLPSQGSNLPGLTGTWLKICKRCMVAQVGARVSCWWTHVDIRTHTDINTLTLVSRMCWRERGGNGCIPVIDINGFKSPELTF